MPQPHRPRRRPTLFLFWAVLSACGTFGPAGIAADSAAPPPCGYYMCEYERGNIDSVILAHAEISQTIMFGEIHDTVLAGAPPPVGDSLYVASLLPRLRAMGYAYLAVEVDAHAVREGHSLDLVRFLAACRQGDCGAMNRYPHAKPGWIGLVRAAMAAGYAIRFIDGDQETGAAVRSPGGSRDLKMFENLKQQIFDNHPAAKVIIYTGANHVGERPTHTGVYLYKGKRRPLGHFLEAYTGGLNFSVYMGHTDDTPEGCDLFISDFIWNRYRR